MAGHNKWSKVKHRKAVTDKKKSSIYTKCLKEITVAARAGADPALNARLRKALEDARANSVPKDNIDKAVKRGSGELEEGMQLEEVLYEGRGPGSTAILVECVTDNKNRTQPELRKIFEKNGGSIAEKGAVSWAFDTKGIILVPKTAIEENALMDLILEAGAEDMETSDDGYEIRTSPQNFETVRLALEKHKLEMPLSEISKVPKSKTNLSNETAETLSILVDALEDHEDVQKVSHNADF